MNYEEIFWSASVEELKQGFIFQKENEAYICLCCGEVFEDGVIYKENEVLMEAKKAIKHHIQMKHQSMFHHLTHMDKKYTGLTDTQKELIHMFYEGLSDKEITDVTKGSTSTVRNQRFTLREKAKQAKIILAYMDLLEEKMNNQQDHKLIAIHPGATNIDERYAITESERKDFIERYFKEDKLLSFPNKQKRIIVILQHITSNFERNKEYTEKEVNDILKEIYSDYVTIRRYLIEYGFMERTRDCKKYWIK